MRTANPGHLTAFDYLGIHRYFLTFCTFRRTAIFTSASAVDPVLGQIQRAARDERMALLAYCFMPDHVHLLVEGESETSDCLSFIKRAKQLSGYSYTQRTGERLWQRYGFERVLRNHEATLGVARYIIENPIRAGLVIRAEEYAFVGSERYTIREILDAIQMHERLV